MERRSTCQPPRIRAALEPIGVEHLQELRDFGAPPIVREAVALTMWVLTEDPTSTWDDAVAMWTHPSSFDHGLRAFLDRLHAYVPGSDRAWEHAVYAFLLTDAVRTLDRGANAAGAVLVDFLTAVLEHEASA